MGLAERRAVKAFQDSKYPKLKQEIDAAAGFEVNIDVKWDTLAEEGYSHLYEDAFVKVYFKPLVESFKAITVDDLGKEALKDGLKKVVVSGGNNYASFTMGTLTVDYPPITNVEYWNERKQQIQEALERGL